MKYWTKITNELPPDEKHVLLYDKTEGICVGYIREDYFNHHPLGTNASDALLFYVTHWMELPIPPIGSHLED